MNNMFFLTHRIIFPQLVRLEINMKLNFHEKLPEDDEANISKFLPLLLMRCSLLEFEISVQTLVQTTVQTVCTVQTEEYEI